VTPREQRYANPLELAAALAQQLGATLLAACRERGAASLAVSGGKTPLPLFEALHEQGLDWPRIWLTLVDERWVSPDDPDSNERLLRDSLLQGNAANTRFIPLKNSAPTAAAGASLAWSALRELPRPFDVVILGMGDDGHTASLFPQSPGLGAALDAASAPACIAMTAPTAPTERISLNLAALLQARRLILHITGAAKWELYQRALRDAAYPVNAVLTQTGVPVEVHWSP
jgi:6-phosphogluconolactonase